MTTIVNKYLRSGQVLFLCGLVFLFVSCAKNIYISTSFHEPANEGLRFIYSYDGYQWTAINKTWLSPQVGNSKIMRDPSMVQGPDGTFHLVWTTEWKGGNAFGYAASKDLIHWSEQRSIPAMAYEPTTVNVWAPELFYDKTEKQFSIVWASCIPGRFEKGMEADSNNHRLYVTTTKDFQTFTPTKLFLDPGFSSIDAVIVKKATNDFVLVFKDNTRPNRNIKVAFSEKALGPYTNVSAPLTESFTEGPSVLKKDDYWLIYYDAYRKKTYDALKTSDFKTFTDVSKEVHIPEGHKHGTIFQVKKGLLKKLIK